MSKARHNSYRKILSIENSSYTSGSVTVDVKIVLWCTPLSYTSRTIKTGHIMYSVYINNKTGLHGISGWHLSQKPVSLNIKNPMKSKFFVDRDLTSTRNKAFTGAWDRYLNTLNNLTGIVTWFSHGEGFVKCLELDRSYPIYACNIPNARTGYPETACVYYERDQKIEFNFKHGFVVPTTEGHFDSEKWDSLDQSKLAFKRDVKTGKFTNGLF